MACYCPVLVLHRSARLFEVPFWAISPQDTQISSFLVSKQLEILLYPYIVDSAFKR